MHKRIKNGRKKKDHGLLHSDITISDFANTDPNKYVGVRERKSIAALNKKAMNQEVEQLSWFEKDLEEFDLDLQQENEDEEDMTEEIKVPVVKVRKSKKRGGVRDDGGLTYPVDLWIILSSYILPESVAAFARLCRGTNTVVHTALFWKSILRRFYIEEPDLPERLRLTSLDSLHGLRTNTIKLLYHVYQPFCDRITTTDPFQDEPHALVGQRCLLTWHKKVKNIWKFYFKFRKGDKVDLSSNCRKSIDSPAFEKWHQDLCYNPDERCSVLEVTCPNFVPQPMVMGLILNRVYFNVSSGSMRYHRLKLILDRNFKVTTARNQMGMVELLIDPVYEIRVYPWWDPNYASSHSIMLENEP